MQKAKHWHFTTEQRHHLTLNNSVGFVCTWLKLADTDTNFRKYL